MSPQRRKQIRLKDYDYRQQGYYFVTFCAFQRRCIFGDVVDTTFDPNVIGQTIEQAWAFLPEHFLNVTLDVMQVMPNHVHAIIIIEDVFRESSTDPEPFNGAAKLGQIVGYWKYHVSKQLNAKSKGITIWQDNMYEHVIRNERELQLIHQYIVDNPGTWMEDHEHPSNHRRKPRLTNTEIVDRLLAAQNRAHSL